MATRAAVPTAALMTSSCACESVVWPCCVRDNLLLFAVALPKRSTREAETWFLVFLGAPELPCMACRASLVKEVTAHTLAVRPKVSEYACKCTPTLCACSAALRMEVCSLACFRSFCSTSKSVFLLEFSLSGFLGFQAIKHTPTLVDLYLVKGRIYKHAGAYTKACEWHEVARSLDLADR